MASSALWLVGTALVLAMVTTRVTAVEEDYTEKFNSNVENVFGNISETIKINALPELQVNQTGIIVLKIDLADIDITGLPDITATQFTYDTETQIVKITLTEASLQIFAHHLAMEGVLFGNININGTGDGWFWLENFECSIEGTTSNFDFNGTRPIIHFENVTLTLDLEQWTVDMRGLTPGSDLTQMMNSVLTMLGPEIFHALGDSITDTIWFRTLVNGFFSDPNGNMETQDGTGGEAINFKTINHQDTDWVPQEKMQEFMKLQHPLRMASLGRH